MKVLDFFKGLEMRQKWLHLIIMVFVAFHTLAHAQENCDRVADSLKTCSQKNTQCSNENEKFLEQIEQLRNERMFLVILCAVLFIACTLLAWSRSPTPEITSGDSHVAADPQAERLKKLETEHKELETKHKKLTNRFKVYTNLLIERKVNVTNCLIMRPLLELEFMWLFKLCKNIKQMIDWSLHSTLLVEVIFLLIVFLPLIVISCLACEIWSKQTVSLHVMLTAMNTTLELVMTPSTMVLKNIMPFVSAMITKYPTWFTAIRNLIPSS